MDDFKLDKNFGTMVMNGDFVLVHGINYIEQMLRRRLYESKVVDYFLGKPNTAFNAEHFKMALSRELNYDNLFAPGGLYIDVVPVKPDELYVDIYYNHPSTGLVKLTNVAFTYTAGQLIITFNEIENLNSNIESSYNNNKYLRRKTL